MDLGNTESEVPLDIGTQDDHHESPPKQRIAVIGNMTPDLHPTIIRGEIDMLTVGASPEVPKLEVPEILSKKAIKLKIAEMTHIENPIATNPIHKAMKLRKKTHPHKRSISSDDRRTLKANGGAWWLKAKR